mmetsp:Transcript_16140/g.56286  ORF Transcript_16140/g.56286 Transcript_16140/m.56286 type:complete len:219 (-) Transcript_16140:2729-3385(-)
MRLQFCCVAGLVPASQLLAATATPVSELRHLTRRFCTPVVPQFCVHLPYWPGTQLYVAQAKVLHDLTVAGFSASSHVAVTSPSPSNCSPTHSTVRVCWPPPQAASQAEYSEVTTHLGSGQAGRSMHARDSGVASLPHLASGTMKPVSRSVHVAVRVCVPAPQSLLHSPHSDTSLLKPKATSKLAAVLVVPPLALASVTVATHSPSSAVAGMVKPTKPT